MSPNRRIILNIAASYGRSLIGVLCGIFSTRWVLMALGHESFGLFGVVGSLVLFVRFLNIQFSSALSRFYAFSIGKANTAKDKAAALDECRDWFTTGVVIHTVLPMLLVAAGYPLGRTAIVSGWLTIPSDRIETCVWLWRFSMMSCFIGMVNVPFQAMFTAKQYISELTVYSLMQVVAKTGFIYYMTTVEKDWLMDYGLATCIIGTVPQLLICARALQVFPECRIRLASIRLFSKVRQIANFAWWQAFGGVGYLAQHQGLAIIVNKYFGPSVNAAYSVGVTVGGEAAALTGALHGAFGPAVTTAYGEGNQSRMKKLAYGASKFGTFLTMVFAIPMCLEISQILRIWLGNPPPQAKPLCLGWLLVAVVEKLSLGQGQATHAVGKVGWFQFFRGVACMTSIPLSILLIMIDRRPYMIGCTLTLTTALACVSDVCVSKFHTGLSVGYWLRRIVTPLGVVALLGMFSGLCVQVFMRETLLRVIVVTFVSLLVLCVSAWIILLDDEDRTFLAMHVKRKLKSRKG
jgi:O-antigen/teichoic acid export membrane protein